MSCDNTEDVRIIVKYSSFPGEEPTIPNSGNHEDGTWLPTDLYVGEMFVNAYDNKAWVRGINGIFPIGATGGTMSFIGDFVPASTGGTFSGPIYSPTFSGIGMSVSTIYTTDISADVITANYFVGDGSGLTNIVAVWNGGTVSNPTAFMNDVYVNAPLHINDTIEGPGSIVNVNSDLHIINGYGISASYFCGDGSCLTNLPVGTYSNYYTISATLSGNIIQFNRNDLAPAYEVDLTPILATDSISFIDWDGATETLTLNYESGSSVSAVIDTFSNLGLDTLNVNDVYAGNIYGTFIGTYSNDIYTISATLSGTEAIFERTDGTTYSLDLSYFSGGGTASGGATQSLGQTLTYGNITNNNNIALTGNIFSGETDYIVADGNAISGGFNFEYNTGTTWYPRIIAENATGDQSIVRLTDTEALIQSSRNVLGTDAYTRITNTYDAIRIDAEDLISLNSVRNEITPYSHVVSSTNPTFQGIEYASDYSANFTGQSLVTKSWVQSEITLGIIDTYGTRTDKVFANADPGMRTGITSDDGPTGATGSVLVDVDGAYISALDNDYNSVIEVTNEIISMKAGSTNLATDYTEWQMALGTFYKNFVSTTITPGVDDKLQTLERSQSWTFDASSPGNMTLFYDNYEQYAIMDYEIDFFIRSQSASGKFMTYKIRKNGYYDGGNTFYPILPTDTQKGTDPSYDNGTWDIQIQGTGVGDRYEFYWDASFVDGYIYTITAHIKTKQKKY